MSAGDTVEVGQVILTLDASEDGEPQANTREEESRPAEPAGRGVTRAEPPPAPPPEVTAPAPSPPVAPPPHIPASEEGALPVFASPSTRTFAREIGVDVRQVRGSGPGGRISDEDVKLHSRTRVFAEPGDGDRPPPARLFRVRPD